MSQDLSGKPEAPHFLSELNPDSERPLSKLPEWIRVLPLGTVEFSDQREPFMVDEAALRSMVVEFRSRGIDLVIDYEHQSLQGERPPAAGWIKELEAQGDGLWARVDWTQQARDYLEKREYRYFSPVLRLDPETRRPVALLYMGLTNVPALKHLGFFPANPPPIGDLLAGEVERPLSAEETAGLAVGDPFKEHGLPDARHENAAGKAFCGKCVYKTPIKGEWRCTNQKGAHFGPDGGTFGGYPCPALQSVLGQHISCPGFFPKPPKSRPPQPKKKSLPVPEGVKFLYVRKIRGPWTDGLQKHGGVVTVAWAETTPGRLRVAFSFCSPKDRWCKATGRNMAAARLFKHSLVIPFLYDAKRTVHEVVRAVLSHDFGRLAALTPGATMWGRIPSWTRALGKRMEEKERMLDGRIKRLKVPSLPDFLGGIYLAPPSRDLPFNIMARMMRDIAALGNH